MPTRALRALLTAPMLCLAWAAAPAAKPSAYLPDAAIVEVGYTDTDSIITRMAASPLHPVEGLWQMADDGAVIAIEQSEPYTADQTMARGYRIVIVQSPCRRVRPGTLMGYALPSAKAGRYDAAIYTGMDDHGLLHRSHRFTLELHDAESRLAFIRHRADLRVNLWRLIPYLFRVSVTTGNDRPRDMDGAIRIFPESDAAPANPRYL